MSFNLLNPLKMNLRQGNMNGLQFHLGRILKKANETTCPIRLRTEIFLEVVKTYRALNRVNEAANLCDLAISHIPADSVDLLSALKRLRSLLYLDQGELINARNLIDETDGLELVLQGGRSLVNRSDSDVTVETWLVSTEIAIAEQDLSAAQKFFDNAVSRLSIEETELRRQRISPIKRQVEQYYHDLSQILNLYGLTLSLLSGDELAREQLHQLRDTIRRENESALNQRRLPNVPLYSKLVCFISGWSGQGDTPEGISEAEARRWKEFGSPEFMKQIQSSNESKAPVFAENLLSSVSDHHLPHWFPFRPAMKTYLL